MSLRPDPGSFRDPTSRVFLDDTTAWRGLSEQGLADFDAYSATGAFRRALGDGRLIDTELLGTEASPLDGAWAGVLRHRRIETITYPYEWTFSMLRDAALLQLALAREALADGVLLKDATPYNVQFDGSRPVFIDVGSFQRLVPGEPWLGYRQFCELFLNPLYLQSIAGVPFQPWLRGSLEGVTPATAAAILGPRKRLRRDVLTHVRLHARAEARYADADSDRDISGELKRAGFGPKIIDAQMANLQRSVGGLEWKKSASTWSTYAERGHYTDADLEAKSELVSKATATLSRPLVLDLGANDGHFSKVALSAGASRVVAVDSDHLVVDHLYRHVRSSGEDRILPLVIDLADPSPSRGWRGRERPAFVDRVRPDLVLCLAVVHHLALTNTVPFDGIVAFLRDFDAPLVVELPHPDDPMAARLLARKRAGLFDHYQQATWEKALRGPFTTVEQVTLPSGTRTLYLCEPR